MNKRWLIAGIALTLAGGSFAQQLYEIPQGVETRWVSFENPTGAKGQGGKTAGGRKGSFYKAVKPGETLTLADLRGPGVIRRFWAPCGASPRYSAAW